MISYVRYIAMENNKRFFIISGTLSGNVTLRNTKNASFHTASSNDCSIENIPRTNSQESSSKHHPWCPEGYLDRVCDTPDVKPLIDDEAGRG